MSDQVKVFTGLNQEEIAANTLLLDILDLNGEQLTYYFEEELIENPFIEFEYPIEQRVPAIPKEAGQEEQYRIDPQSPRSPQTLETFLYEQILLYRQTPIRDVMIQLINFLDKRGYIPYSYQEIASKLQVEPMVALDALTLIKQLEPSGIGAYDLRECLMLQTEQDPHAPNVAYYILESFFEELSDEDYVEIESQSHLTREEIKLCVNYYHTLRSSPASLFDRPDRINLIPDVSVKLDGVDVEVRFNRQYYPRLRFNQTYYEEMEAKKDLQLRQYIRPHKEQYETLINCLRLREELITRVTKVIVKAQAEFFVGQRTSPAPLLLKDIAEQMRLSESIVRAIVVNKNLAFNEVVFAFTDFINVSARIGRNGLSALNIQGFIRDIMTKQGPDISDQEIVELLEKQKISISTQLVMRYRKNILQKEG